MTSRIRQYRSCQGNKEAVVEGERTNAELKDYVERWGMLFEFLGGTRMMGKILGWLLVCDPPEQSASDIARAVGASAGTVSTTTRALLQAAMIERIGVPGKRSAYFRVRPGMWADLLKRRMEYGRTMGQLAEEGLGLISGSDDDAALRLREIGSYCRFVESELPVFVARWEKEWEKERNE